VVIIVPHVANHFLGVRNVAELAKIMSLMNWTDPLVGQQHNF
jgi:hypothetical protein